MSHEILTFWSLYSLSGLLVCRLKNHFEFWILLPSFTALNLITRIHKQLYACPWCGLPTHLSSVILRCSLAKRGHGFSRITHLTARLLFASPISQVGECRAFCGGSGEARGVLVDGMAFCLAFEHVVAGIVAVVERQWHCGSEANPPQRNAAKPRDGSAHIVY